MLWGPQDTFSPEITFFGHGVTKLDGMVGNPGAAQASVALNMSRYDLAAVAWDIR
jgi:hypothetical protein